jgi:hybrid cluster-associated redox disulfide protein
VAGLPFPDDSEMDLPVSEYLARRPEALTVLLDLRLRCVGCDFGGFDTLQQALGVHGVAPEDFLRRLSFVGSNPQTPEGDI